LAEHIELEPDSRPSLVGTVFAVAVAVADAGCERRAAGATLMPRMQARIEGGFTAPPEESTLEVHTQVSA
jgi:hypothetical protein